MTGASLGLRSSGSYGSLQSQQFQNPNQSSPPLPASCRKPSKMFNKDKERLCPWFRKCFSPNTKVGMLLLCICSGAVFFWVVSVGKGEGTPETSMKNIQFNNTLDYSGYSPVILENASTEVGLQTLRLQSPPLPLTPLAYFTGYTLPPGNPCESFTLPPPPADPKRTGPRPCPVCYLPMEQVLALMPNASSFSPILKNLAYIQEETLTKTEFGGSEFGGYPSIQQRSESYDIKESMNVHCGFVRGVKPGQGTGFDIDVPDLLEMESCQGVVVASAIFGAFDLIRQPKNISEYAKQNVCFYMFVDEDTEKFLRNSSALDDNKKSGLWRIVVVRNLPYSDPRRNGKVPKLLIHRLFPNARYSLWIDGKLELVVDPYQLLERNLMMDLEGIGFSSRRNKIYIALTSHGDINAHFIEFLWRKNASFAISRHYKRFDVFVEAEANKAAGKYENASIDFQIDFYRKEGLTPYSSAKLPITSDVPEGCVIIREHVPISNLFTCLWFNEVDRFTSRDQISFSTVRDKIHAKTNWTISMFLDCERRNFVIQGYHRDVLESLVYPPPPPASHDGIHPPSPVVNVQQNSTEPVSTDNESTNPTKKVPIRRGRERRSRRHRKVAAGSKDITPLP